MAVEKQDTFNRIAAIVADKLHIDAATIKADATLQDMGADSLDMVEIILKIEEEFNIQVNDQEAEQLHTMQDVVDYVHARRQ